MPRLCDTRISTSGSCYRVTGAAFLGRTFRSTCRYDVALGAAEMRAKVRLLKFLSLLVAAYDGLNDDMQLACTRRRQIKLICDQTMRQLPRHRSTSFS